MNAATRISHAGIIRLTRAAGRLRDCHRLILSRRIHSFSAESSSTLLLATVLGQIPVLPVSVLEPHRVVLNRSCHSCRRSFVLPPGRHPPSAARPSRLISYTRSFPFGEAFACDWHPSLWRCIRTCHRGERGRGGRREGELRESCVVVGHVALSCRGKWTQLYF